MSKTRSLILALAVVAITSVAITNSALAAEKSGLQPGDHVPAYIVEKVAGNAHDNVDVGASLCYRCKLGSRPVVTVFTRKADANVANLMKALDQVVVRNSDKKAASFVNLLGEDTAALKSDAAKLLKASGAEHVAVVVPSDHANGPAEFKISPSVEVTVLVYNKGKVEANHSLSASELNATTIARIVADAGKMLN